MSRLSQVKERLLKILTFWADRKLYDKDTMQQLEAALLSGDPNAMLQAPAPKQVCAKCAHVQHMCSCAVHYPQLGSLLGHPISALFSARLGLLFPACQSLLSGEWPEPILLHDMQPGLMTGIVL